MGFEKVLRRRNATATAAFLPNNEQKYISFSIKENPFTKKDDKCFRQPFEELRFLDSFSFVSEALSKLADSMKVNKFEESHQAFESTRKAFKYTAEAFPDREQFILAIRKGVYPYEHMDENTAERMKETKLPPISSFISKLTSGEIYPDEKKKTRSYSNGIEEKEYKHAQLVWDTFKCKTMKDYHDLYLKIDVLLLTDIFETFRNKTLSQYQLDPCNYFTLPGLSWDALLYTSGQKLELLTDMEMVNFVESGIRGGISVISHRHAKLSDKSNETKWN